jgi:Arc/MetJ family transcription regulator
MMSNVPRATRKGTGRTINVNIVDVTMMTPQLTDTQESEILTHRGFMRTNIDIDDRLMRQAMRRSGARTKRAVVEEGLRLLIQTRRQGGIRRLRGKVAWQGDLNSSRLERQAK